MTKVTTTIMIETEDGKIEIIEGGTIENAKMITRHLNTDFVVLLLINESKTWGGFSGLNLWADVNSAMKEMGLS